MSATEPFPFDWALPTAFAALGFVCWYFRISYGISIVVGVILLFGVALAVLVGREDAASFAAILALYFLVVGIALAVVEVWGKELRKNVVLASPDVSRVAGRPVGSSRPFGVRNILQRLRERFRR